MATFGNKFRISGHASVDSVGPDPLKDGAFNAAAGVNEQINNQAKERRKTSFHFNLQEHNASSINLVKSHIFIDDCSIVIMDLPYNKYWILLPKLLWCFKTLYRNIKNTPVINDLE